MSWGNAKRRAKKKLHSHRSEFISTNAVRAIEKGTSTRLTSKRFFPEIFQMLYVASCCRCWDANRDFWCIYQNQTDSLQKKLFIYIWKGNSSDNECHKIQKDWLSREKRSLSFTSLPLFLSHSFRFFWSFRLSWAGNRSNSSAHKQINVFFGENVIINSLA